MALHLLNTPVHFPKPVRLFETHSLFPSNFSQKHQIRPSNGFFTTTTTISRSTHLSPLKSSQSPSLSTMATDLETQRPKQNDQQALTELWRKIHGENDWFGLLEPMNPLLRSELIRYGELCQATYDSFDFDSYSKYCGSCRFPKERFFESLDMVSHGYQVTRYLYATANINLPKFFKKSQLSETWSRNANWMGYVSVSNDEMSKRIGRRDINIAWRGTVTKTEWVADMMFFLKPITSSKIPCPDDGVKVESGFLDLYIDKDEKCNYCKYSAREQILSEVKRLMEKYEGEELSITVTGHSLGAALAVLSSYDIMETGLHIGSDNQPVPVCTFTFCGPRVGNLKFKERVDALGLKVLRVVSTKDVVPKSPGLILNEKLPPTVAKVVEFLPGLDLYSHVGVELQLDHSNSPFLEETDDAGDNHNLEAHLHTLDGYHGKDEKFVLTSGRDPALVNKSSSFLKKQYSVPTSWRQDQNKGLIRNSEGRWVLPDRPKLEDHPKDMHHHLTKIGLASNQ